MAGPTITSWTRSQDPRSRTRCLFLVMGPTGMGKTDHAFGLAGEMAAPVVVLDRVQCHRELAVGSNRPSPQKLSQAKVFFLDDRRVADGVISGRLAYENLLCVLDRLWSAGSDDVVLEGGSMSLLTEMADDRRWRAGADVVIDYLKPASWPDYRLGPHQRVNRMLTVGHGGRTMIDETCELWPDPAARAVSSTVVGYRELIELGRRSPGSAFELAETELDQMREEVVEAHLRYGAEQTALFDTMVDKIRT